MKDLFNKYVKQNKITEALLLGQNMLSRDCKRESLELYLNLLFQLINYEKQIELIQRNCDQGYDAISYFCDNALLDENDIIYVKNQKSILDSLVDEKIIKPKLIFNKDALSLIGKLADKVLVVNSEQDLNKVIEQIKSIDERVDSSYFSFDEKKKYESLTNKCSSNINLKIEHFENLKKIDYNNKAVAAYSDAYEFFKKGNNFDDHSNIIKGLFSFDNSKLFSETIIYYNHVYSYIFNKLSDDDKLNLTKVAINMQKGK